MPKKILTYGIISLISTMAIVGVSFAQSIPTAPIWKTLGGYILPINSLNGLEVPALGGSGTRCVQTDNSGNLAKASAACGSGGGGSGVGTSTNPFMATYYVATSTTATSTFNGAVKIGPEIGFNSSLFQVNGYNSAAIFTTPDDAYSVSTEFLNTLANAAQMIFRGDDSLVSSMRNGDIQYKEVNDSILAETDAYHTALSDDYQAMLDSAQYDIRSGGNINFLTGGTPTNIGYSLGTLRATIDRTGNFGIGTSSPSSLLSVGDTSGINFRTATSSFSSTGGIDLKNGCYAIRGTCVGGGSGGSSFAYLFTPTTNYGVTNQATTGIAFFQNGMNASSTSHFVNASTSQASADVVYSPKIIFGKDANGNNEQITSAGDRIRIEAEGQDAFIELNPLNGDVYTQCCDFTADGLMHGIVDGSDGSTFILNVPGGNIKHGTLTKTVSYTASVGDDIIFVNGLTKTITLPTAVGNIGHSFLVKLVTNSTSTVNTTSSQTIDGSLTYPLTELNKYVQVVSNGANWWVIGDNSSLLGASASAGYFTATSTTSSVFPYASTTQLSSNLLYLTGATNATVGLIDDSNYTYWGTASRNGSIRYQFNHDANGGEFQMRASHSIAFVPGDDQIYDGHVQLGYAGPSYTPWTVHDNGAADREIISMSISGGTNYQAGDVIAIQGGTSNGCSVTLGASQVSAGAIVNFSSGNAYHKLSGCGGNGSAGAGGYSVGATTASNAHGGTPATVSITEVADVRPSNKLNFDSKINIGGESQNGFSVSQHSEGDSATGIGKFIWGCWDGGYSGADWGDETANKAYGIPCLTLTSSSTLTAGQFVASTSLASIFPYASTTALSATALCLTGDTCRTTWPTSGSGSYPFTLTGNATSTKTQFNGGLTSYASSTIGDGTTVGGLTVNGSATTTGNLQVGTGATTAFTVLPSNGFVGAGTSTPWRQLSVNGSSDLGTNAYAGYFTATTSTASSFPYASTTMVSATTASSTNLYVSSAGTAAGTILAADSSGKVIATTSPISSQWTTSGTKIYYTAGNVGIGTTTPPANLTMIAASSTVASDKYNGNVSIIGGKENTTEVIFDRIDQWGHHIVSGDVPAISSCGTGSISSDSNDRAGRVTFSNGITSCTVTFAHAYPTGSTVHVFLNQETGTPASYGASSVSTTGFIITGPTFDVYDYQIIATQ